MNTMIHIQYDIYFIWTNTLSILLINQTIYARVKIRSSLFELSLRRKYRLDTIEIDYVCSWTVLSWHINNSKNFSFYNFKNFLFTISNISHTLMQVAIYFFAAGNKRWLILHTTWLNSTYWPTLACWQMFQTFLTIW